MFNLLKIFFALCLILFSLAAIASPFPDIGRAATPQEIAAWDIDVRGDFKGLPSGSGSVAQGNALWDEKCAACHGSFAEATGVFGPIVGGTTQSDISSGRVSTAAADAEPKRSTIMKINTLSTLWDYIRRAMPWNAPRSLTADEVYALTAYILHMADILPADYVLSEHNIAEVQQRLPNRKGMTRQHGLWDVKGKADVHNSACMKNCLTHIRITSVMPDYACDAHGDLKQQNRNFGAVRGAAKSLVCQPDPDIKDLNKLYNSSPQNLVQPFQPKQIN